MASLASVQITILNSETCCLHFDTNHLYPLTLLTYQSPQQHTFCCQSLICEVQDTNNETSSWSCCVQSRWKSNNCVHLQI